MNEQNNNYSLFFSIRKIIFIIQNKFLNNKYKIRKLFINEFIRLKIKNLELTQFDSRAFWLLKNWLMRNFLIWLFVPIEDNVILTDTGENEPKCAVYFRRGAESYSSFGLLNYFLWWGEVNRWRCAHFGPNSPVDKFPVLACIG